MSVSKCNFCKSRYSWDCDDGSPYPENGCEHFALDKNSLTEEEQRIFVLSGILRGEKNG